MPFEDIGTTKRLAMSQMRVLRIWEASAGICCLCDRPIDGTRDRWYVEHIRALELGGADLDGNCAPAHYTCKPAKDADDHSRAAEAKREKAAELAIPKRSTLRGRGFAKAERKRSASVPVNKWFGPSLQRTR
ncbi:HNH endonuclease [Methylobacterium nigriterrae]|uniref:HNH endonuclease n=1 Tax=Methylobacterium nigriterrae TaxID=3127512 RepID=UPI0030135F10